MHFYELHEGDDDVFYDAIVLRDEEMDADEFFTLVQTIRRQLQESFETDTLIEAIAEELERSYGFVYVSDDRLTAAVNVSRVESDNFLADLEEGDEEEEVSVTGDADYRGVYADFEAPDSGRN